MASRGITLRFRTKVGMWRLDDVDPHDSTFLELKARLASERQVDVPSMTISATFGGPPVDDAATPAELRAQNGQIMFLDVGEDVIPAQVGRKVAADGQIVAMSHQEMKDKMAFRPGGVAMRDIKKHWTWMDFEEYQKAFEFRVARQKEAHCKGAQLDAALCRDFQSHVERFAYQRCHFAFLYGLFRPDNEIEVLATFEPLQVRARARGRPQPACATACLPLRRRARRPACGSSRTTTRGTRTRWPPCWAWSAWAS